MGGNTFGPELENKVASDTYKVNINYFSIDFDIFYFYLLIQ